MSSERLIAAHEQQWTELEEVVRQSSPRSPEQVDVLITRYRQATTHLAQAQARGDQELTRQLTALVAEAYGSIHGPRPRSKRALRRFFTETFPAAVWWHRRFIVVSALLFLVPAVTIGAWMAVSADAVQASAPQSVRDAYLERDFEAYYSSEPAAQFATEVFINNIQVAILAFAMGILLCLPTAWVLVSNGALIGLAGGLFTAAGRWEHFWGLITPHGLLEVSAIIVSGAAGFALGWSVIAPGDQTRRASVAEAGMRSVVVVVGLIMAFLVAGLIEGFVTGSDLHTAIRVGIGVASLVGFAAWVLLLGPPAARRGLSGRFNEAPTENAAQAAANSR